MHSNQLRILKYRVSQPTHFSDFQLNEANYSNQSTVTPHDFPTVFPHEPTPFTAHTPTTSASRILKASSLTPLTSILKQGKRDAISYRSGSVPKRSRRQGWRCSLQTHATNPNVVSRQTAGLSKRGEYKTRDMKPPTAPSSE